MGGWEFVGTYTYYSGQFLTPAWTGPDPTGTTYTTSLTAPMVTIRPNIVSDPNVGPHTVNQWFNPRAFAAPAVGSYGTSAPGVIKGPPVNTWRAGIVKRFQVTEKMRLRWDLTAINVLNHPNWSNPATNISNASAGVISGVGGVNGSAIGDQPGARSLQTSASLEW